MPLALLASHVEATFFGRKAKGRREETNGTGVCGMKGNRRGVNGEKERLYNVNVGAASLSPCFCVKFLGPTAGTATLFLGAMSHKGANAMQAMMMGREGGGMFYGESLGGTSLASSRKRKKDTCELLC